MAAIRLSSQAKKSYLKLGRSDQRIFKRVDDALTRLGRDPRAGKSLAGPLRDYRSLRIGSLRIVYKIDPGNRVVEVLDIGQRGAIYR